MRLKAVYFLEIKMEHIQAITYKSPIHRKQIFLAGGITDCPDWQKEVVISLKDFPVTIYNPRRESFDVSKEEETERQIIWEYQYIRGTTHLLFWFPKETVCPITLFEYGAALERNTQKIIVGCDPEYKRKIDLIYQTRQKGFSAPDIKFSLKEIIEDLDAAQAFHQFS